MQNHNYEMEIIEKTMGGNVVYKMIWSVEDCWKESVFFPQEWSRQDVALAIQEAYNYCAEREKDYFLEPYDCYRLEGFSKNGMKIKMIINEDGKMLLACPVME